jgi:hypothetical protein
LGDADAECGHPDDLQEVCMAIPLIRLLCFLFQPERSARMNGNDETSIKALPSARRPRLVSLKALVWVVISILAGLMIGQLS